LTTAQLEFALKDHGQLEFALKYHTQLEFALKDGRAPE